MSSSSDHNEAIMFYSMSSEKYYCFSINPKDKEYNKRKNVGGKPIYPFVIHCDKFDTDFSSYVQVWGNNFSQKFLQASEIMLIKKLKDLWPVD